MIRIYSKYDLKVESKNKEIQEITKDDLEYSSGVKFLKESDFYFDGKNIKSLDFDRLLCLEEFLSFHLNREIFHEFYELILLPIITSKKHPAKSHKDASTHCSGVKLSIPPYYFLWNGSKYEKIECKGKIISFPDNQSPLNESLKSFGQINRELNSIQSRFHDQVQSLRQLSFLFQRARFELALRLEHQTDQSTSHLSSSHHKSKKAKSSFSNRGISKNKVKKGAVK